MNSEKIPIKLGSLFDGIGAAPLAASFFGIAAVWASEILPNAISVTKRHFPGMDHLGDITKLDGGKITPVDIIAFGSPCQSWSIAGTRTGFEGKSGLFTEAIRIIREMREATDGEYPKIVLFENVTGLLSSGKGSYAGRDYKTVLEAFCESEIPMPQSGRWANAGMVRGRGIDLAWVVKDAQHHRTAQRRRRLFVVVDFAGQRAGEILFVPQSLSGYFAARGGEGERTSPDPESGAGGACCGMTAGGNQTVSTLCASYGTKWNGNAGAYSGDQFVAEPVAAYGETGRGYWQDGVQTIRAQGENHPSHPSNVVVGAFMAGQAKNARSIAYNESVSPTLKGSPSGLNQVPCICEPELARALMARGDSSPCADRGQNIIAFAQNQRDEVRDLNGVAGALAAEPGVKQQTYIAQPTAPKCLTPWDTQQARVFTPDGTSPTLAGADGGGGRNPAGVIMIEPPAVGVHQNQSGEVSTSETAYTLSASSNASARNAPLVAHPAVVGTICASGAGTSRPAGNANETDLCVAYCLQGNMIGRKDENGPQGSGVNKDVSFTVSAADRHAVAAVDCRNLKECNEVSGTLQAKNGAGYSLNYQNPVRTGYIVRRLTPTECERLMSLPDGWTEHGHNGKPMSDSARYQMCGNSIVVNCLAYIMQNIAAHLREGDGHV
jgi:DNA (cytosine-5)-methyltransferase 1